MKVQLLRSITSIQRALPRTEKLSSTIRTTLSDVIDEYDHNFAMRADTLPYTCGIIELGGFETFTTTEQVQLQTINRLLLGDCKLDVTTSPISIDIPYGVTFTIIDNENDRNIRDAILGILPFKLIGKGVSTKTNNPLETWGLFPEPTA